MRSASLDLATDAFAASHLVDTLDLDAIDFDATTSSSSSCGSDVDMLPLSLFESSTSPTAAIVAKSKSLDIDDFSMQSALFDSDDAMMWTPDNSDDDAESDGFESDDITLLALSSPSPPASSVAAPTTTAAAAAASTPLYGHKCASRLEVDGSWVMIEMSDIVILETPPSQSRETHATASEPPASASAPTFAPSPVSTPRTARRRRATAAASTATISPVNTRQRTAARKSKSTQQQKLGTVAAATTTKVQDALQATAPSLQRPRAATTRVPKTTATTTASTTTRATAAAAEAVTRTRRPGKYKARAADPTTRVTRRKSKQRGYERNYRGRLRTQRCHDEVTWLECEAALRNLLAHKQALVLGPRTETKTTPTPPSMTMTTTQSNGAASPTTTSVDSQRVLRKYTQLVHEECALKEERVYLRAVDKWLEALDIWGVETEASRTLRFELNTLPQLHAYPTFTGFDW